MSQSHSMVIETADRLFADLAANARLDFAGLWRQVAEAGFP